MATSSATGGYLSPVGNAGDINDQALDIFFQGLVAGITGIPGPLVRPRWQENPPAVPAATIDWAAIGIVGSIKRDPFAYMLQTATADTVSGTAIRNRTMDVLCSFYGPNAGFNSELLAMGLEVPQNREQMQLAGFNLVSGAGDSTVVPQIEKSQWLRRVDIPFSIRQQQRYTYTVLTILGAVATLQLQDTAGNTTTESVVVTTTSDLSSD